MRIYIYSIFIIFTFSCLINASKRNLIEAETPLVNFQESTVSDSMEEQNFQENVNQLFDNEATGIDTTGWNNYKIKMVWFDYRTMTSMIKIPLVDSTCSRFFTPPCDGYITSGFGARDGFWHFGTDIKVRVGDTIRCVFNGIVRVIRNDKRGYGKVVVVRHHNGLETIYGHLSKITVQQNQTLCSGEVIGLGGNTGRSTGSHLHFETRYCGEPFNPCNIVDIERSTLLYDTLYLAKETFDYLTELRKTVYYTIRKGDNLGSIARRYRTSVSAICALNRIKPSTILKLGRKIVVRKPSEIEIAGGESRVADTLQSQL
jgi:murein DD-endopeptidase MepM/ murein hydrolase activator NlpD